MNKDKKRHRRFGGSHPFRKGNMNMEENKQNKAVEPEEVPADDVIVDQVNATPAEEEQAEEVVAESADQEESEEEKLRKEVDKLRADLEKEKKEYMFLMAEMDNFRKRTLKEKSELIRNAAEGAFKGLLPVVDDMERALQHSDKTDDPEVLREGMELIYKKLIGYMDKNGVKPIETTGKPFDENNAEAIAMVPAPGEDMKGKVLDTVEKGYMINDKVLRHAKVAVGQ